MLPFGKTAIIWPVRLVAKVVLEEVDPCPFSTDDDCPASSGLVDAGPLPRMPVMLELEVKVRWLFTVPDCAAVVWTEATIVMVSFRLRAL